LVKNIDAEWYRTKEKWPTTFWVKIRGLAQCTLSTRWASWFLKKLKGPEKHSFRGSRRGGSGTSGE